jgi:hypothetical protein
MKKRAKYKSFRPRIRSRHPSHNVLRPSNKALPLLPFRSVIRFGSSTEYSDTVIRGGKRVELNTVGAIKISSNKLLMKESFLRDEVKTAQWFIFQDGDEFTFLDKTSNETINATEMPFPIIAKAHYGSRNNGNTKLDNYEAFIDWKVGKNMNKYLFEKYYSYNREYRLHVSESGCFYTCRKMLRSDAPEEVRWYRNDDHCVWILEDNESFDKPSNWDEIVTECVKALKAVGLDFGAIDLRVQSATKKNGTVRENPEFIVVEINSAPSFGELTAAKYIEVLPELLTNKFNKLNENTQDTN